MSTHRERREARAARLDQWADKREAKAEAASQRAHEMAEQIPFGQPILAGHHSERADRGYRDRMHALGEKSWEHAGKAKEMAAKAKNIKAQLAESIFDDDPDAVEALTARIVVAVAERNRIKSYNRSCRQGKLDVGVLDDRQRADLSSLTRVGFARPNGSFPSYALTNLNARINRDRKRVMMLEARLAAVTSKSSDDLSEGADSAQEIK